VAENQTPNQTTMGEKMEEENLNLKFNMEAKLFLVYEVNGAVVSIYKVTPQASEDDLLYQQFYLVSFDNGHGEYVFGAGPTPWAALEYAAAAWDLPQDGKPNPFHQVLASSQS